MKKLTLLLTAAFILLAVASNAQGDYKAAIGGRFGEPPVSASFKYFITKAGALEVNAGFWHVGAISYGVNYFTFGAMYQHHFPIGDIKGFQWYVGGGAMVQFYDYDYVNSLSSSDIGVNLVGGVDYKFNNIPLNVSADVMPTVFVGNGYYNNLRGYGGVSVRYVLR